MTSKCAWKCLLNEFNDINDFNSDGNPFHNLFDSTAIDFVLG